MNHLIFSNLNARLATVSDALKASGQFTTREASQAALANAVLAFGVPDPEDLEAGVELLREFMVARLTEPDFTGARREPVNHLIFDVIHERVSALTAAVQAAGLFAERETSQATVVNAVYYRHAPDTTAEGATVLRDFAILRAGGSPDR